MAATALLLNTRRLPPGKAAPPATRRPNRLRRILRIAALVIPILAGLGLWLDSWVKKQAELYRLELQGGVFVSNWGEDEIRRGIGYYQRAVALDPKAATAHAGLAEGWILLSDLHISPREAMPKAAEASLRAIQLNDALPSPHVSLGLVKLQYDWDWAGAEREFKRCCARSEK